MDNTARLWDIETGKVHSIFKGHTAELISLHFNSDGDKILTGSFDKTAIVIMLLFRFGMLEMVK
jgi:dynein assembly factor with WDR repeat domains 1